jgi:hypothetical protein
MQLTVKQLSRLIDYSPQGTRKLLKRLGIVLNKENKYDTKSEHSFSLSLRLQHQHPEWRVLYSIRDLGELHHKDKKTILSLLREADIPMYGKCKKFVYLYDLRTFRMRLNGNK